MPSFQTLTIHHENKTLPKNKLNQYHGQWRSDRCVKKVECGGGRKGVSDDVLPLFVFNQLTIVLCQFIHLWQLTCSVAMSHTMTLPSALQEYATFWLQRKSAVEHVKTEADLTLFESQCSDWFFTYICHCQVPVQWPQPCVQSTVCYTPWPPCWWCR